MIELGGGFNWPQTHGNSNPVFSNISKFNFSLTLVRYQIFYIALQN